MIDIKEITISGINAFLESEEFNTMPAIPISRHRALSHALNPHALPEDIILLLAYENEVLVGYLGAMPDELNYRDKKMRVAWLSCMWVDSQQRGKGIAPMLLTRAHRVWQGRLLITNFIPVAKRAYDKTGLFTEFKILKGVRGYLRFNLTEILISKKPSLKRVRMLLNIVDHILNAFNEVRLVIGYRRLLKNRFSFEYVRDVDEETWKFIGTLSFKHLTPKTVEDFHWLMHYPWILNTPSEDLNSRRYEFSSGIRNFNQLFIKVYGPGHALIAFLTLTSRGSHMKTPYLYYNKENSSIIRQIVLSHALWLGTKTLTTYDPVLSEALQSTRNPFILTRRMGFTFLISKSLKEELGDIDDYIFRDGDGDAAFV